jgi:hypothetical protein
MPSISLPVASYRHRSPPASTSRLVNCMAEQLAPDAKTPFVLARTPGVSQWGTCGTGPIEGLHTDHGLLYAVSGGGFYSITSAATATFRGAVGSSTEIDMDSDESAVVIVSPPLAYSYTPGSTTFATISDADFTSRGAGDVEYLDGYMLFREPDTGRFFSSDLGSVSAYTSTMFATAEGSPDALLGMKVDHRNIVLFGERTVELWENTGVSGFPFERMINGFVEIGCINGKTVAKGDNSVWWVADDYTVRRLDGITPLRVSTHAVEQWLRDVTLVSLRAYFYSLEGHLCYVLTAPEGCFVFDVTTQLWHERQTYGEDTWNWANPVRFAGKVLVGSTTSNVIGELDPEYYYELGETLRAEWTYQPVYNEAARAFHDRLEMVVETGVGLTSGQGSAPEIMLSFSDDGGRTWHNLPNKSLGAIGEYRTRVAWVGLGSCASAHGRVYRAAVSDPVRVAIVDTILSIRGGRL